VAENTPVEIHRTERVLRNMAASAFGLSILGILAILIAGSARVDMTEGIWLTVKVLPAVGIILGTVFATAFLAVMITRRGRAARDASN
jgi:hypothetical protein